MTLKETIAADVRTFLNLDEFGETYSIGMGGVTKDVVAVLDDDTEGQPIVSPEYGINYAVKRLHVRDGDLPKAPMRGKAITVGDETFLVRDISREEGMLMLTLEAHGP